MSNTCEGCRYYERTEKRDYGLVILHMCWTEPLMVSRETSRDDRTPRRCRHYESEEQ